jgi:hypothetical protein
MARVEMLRPKDSEMCSMLGGWLGSHVIAEPVVKKTNRKVARSSAAIHIQKSFVAISLKNILIEKWKRRSLRLSPPVTLSVFE